MIAHLLYFVSFIFLQETSAFHLIGTVGRSSFAVSLSATGEEAGSLNNNDDDMPIIAQSTIKIDDGGSDLTDRFKYKVKKSSLEKIYEEYYSFSSHSFLLSRYIIPAN